jgi:hypothetical protein
MIRTDWNRRIQASIKKEKVEVEVKYGIRIGQTEIYCVRCRRPWGYGGHVCQDIRFKALREAKRDAILIRRRSRELIACSAL